MQCKQTLQNLKVFYQKEIDMLLILGYLLEDKMSIFLESITALGICIDENLIFDKHVNNICLKAARQISALERMAGLLDMPSRKAIY